MHQDLLLLFLFHVLPQLCTVIEQGENPCSAGATANPALKRWAQTTVPTARDDWLLSAWSTPPFVD